MDFYEVAAAADVTEEVREIVRSVHDGWFAGESRVDWEEFLDRVEGHRLGDGRQIDLGSDMTSEGVREIKRYVRALRRG